MLTPESLFNNVLQPQADSCLWRVRASVPQEVYGLVRQDGTPILVTRRQPVGSPSQVYQLDIFNGIGVQAGERFKQVGRGTPVFHTLLKEWIEIGPQKTVPADKAATHLLALITGAALLKKRPCAELRGLILHDPGLDRRTLMAESLANNGATKTLLSAPLLRQA